MVKLFWGEEISMTDIQNLIMAYFAAGMHPPLLNFFCYL